MYRLALSVLVLLGGTSSAVPDVSLTEFEGAYKIVKTCQWSQWYTGQCEGPCSSDNEKGNSGVRESLRRKIIQTSIEILPLENGENSVSKDCVGPYTKKDSCITSRCTSPDQAKAIEDVSYVQKADNSSSPTRTPAAPKITDPVEVLFNHFIQQYLKNYLLVRRPNTTETKDSAVHTDSEPMLTSGPVLQPTDVANTMNAIPKIEEVSEPTIEVTTKMIQTSGVIVEQATTTAPEQAVDKCKYYCQKSGGCSVRILPKSGFVAGKSMGSCFSQRFGGSCIGTPKGCEKCLGICSEKEPGEYILPASGAHVEGVQIAANPSAITGASSDVMDAQNNISGTGITERTETTSESAKDKCKYSCQEGGGCSVRILPASGFLSGSVMGSCFSPRFGGRCFGIPDGCEECFDVCRVKSPGEYTLPTVANVIGTSGASSGKSGSLLSVWTVEPIQESNE